jgi:hypothetical protein
MVNANFLAGVQSQEALADLYAGAVDRTRKTAAYNALRSAYGDVAGDPVAATQLENLRQSQELFPTTIATQRQQLSQARELQPGLAPQQAAILAATKAGTEATQDRTAAEQLERRKNNLLAAARGIKAGMARGGDPGVLFDQYAPVLGYSPEDAAKDRAAIVANPGAVDDLIAALEKDTSPPSSRWQVVQDDKGNLFRLYADGRVEQVKRDDGKPIIGYQAPQAAARIAQREPEARQRTVAAETRGRLGAEAEATLPTLEEAAGLVDDKVDAVLAPDREKAFESLFGSPDFRGITQGGFGTYGEIPGSPAADAAADLKLLLGDVQRAAYESLRGGGAITNAERESIASAYASLERNQSWPSFKRQMQNYRNVVQGVLRAQRRRAGAAAAQPAEETAQPETEAVDYLEYFKRPESP